MKIICKTGAIFSLLFLSAQFAYSCSCQHMTFEEKFAKTGFIFVGKVVEVTEDTKLKRMPHESRRYFVRMEVLETFKGVKRSEITLVQYEVKRHNTSCPYFALESDETYLIYAYGVSYLTWGNKTLNEIRHEVACSPTQRLDPNSPSYKQLVDYKARIQIKKNPAIIYRKNHDNTKSPRAKKDTSR